MTKVGQELNRDNMSKRRSTADMDNSSFIAVVIQILANIEEYRTVLQERGPIRLQTGRLRYYLVNLNDADGHKHSRIYDNLARLVSLVHNRTSACTKLTSEEVVNFRDSIVELKDDWELQERPHSDHKPSKLMDWLLCILDTYQDRSKASDLPDVWVPDEYGLWERRGHWTEQEEQDFEYRQLVAKEQVTLPLQSHVVAHWNAYLASGHDSITTRISTIQLVQTEECNQSDCFPPLRSIEYLNHLTFVLKNAHHRGVLYPSACPIPLSCLPTLLSEESRNEGARICINQRHRSRDVPIGKYTRVTQQIVRTPMLLAIQIDRTVVTGPDSSYTRDGLFIKNRIRDYAVIDLSYLTRVPSKLKPNIFSDIEQQQQHENMNSDGLNRKYVLIGIIAWHLDAANYTAFVRSGKNRWMHFNDNQGTVCYRNPLKDWPNRCIEAMLFYRNDKSAAVNIDIIRREAAKLEAGRQESRPGTGPAHGAPSADTSAGDVPESEVAVIDFATRSSDFQHRRSRRQRRPVKMWSKLIKNLRTTLRSSNMKRSQGVDNRIDRAKHVKAGVADGSRAVDSSIPQRHSTHAQLSDSGAANPFITLKAAVQPSAPEPSKAHQIIQQTQRSARDAS